ncbi:MAG: hypothetical protein KGL19_06035 [Bacteroidota bacterium]|nr:hypothetical protein [Bacteroidota bacterium]
MCTPKSKYSLLIAMLFPLFCLSQQDSSNRKNEFNAGFNFQSKLHYFGRTDSLQSNGLLPNIGFQLKNGLYAQGNFIFVHNALMSTTYAGTTIEAGYKFNQTKHFNGNIFYTQILYKDKMLLPQSALKSQTGINTAYTNKIININMGADLKFSDAQTDIGATAGVDHIFIIHETGSPIAFALDPSAYLYAGTQNFSKTFLQQKDVLGIPVSQQQVTENVNSFNILAYEFSMPVVFVAGKFNASVTPSYVMPQHLLQGENGMNLFYVTVGIGVRL